MRILYVSHTRSWSGAEAAMMRLVDALRAEHDVAIACPARSEMTEVARRANLARYSLVPIDASLRLDPVWTPVGLGQLALGGALLRRAVRHFGPEVMHANGLRAGLLGAIAFARGRPALVVQVHEHLPLTRIGSAVRSLLAAKAADVVGVTERTAANFNQGLRRPVAHRVYISVDLGRFQQSTVVPAPIREELGLPSDAILFGQVAQITPWKGQDNAIRTLAEVRRLGIAANLLIVGDIAFDGRGVRYDNRAFRRDLHHLVDTLGIRDSVHFIGRRDDIPEILRACNLTLFPSRDEPFGTAVAESMAMGVPALVSTDGGPSEFIVDRESGRVLPSDRYDLWAQAAYELLNDRRGLQCMSHKAVDAVARFTDETYTHEMLDVYRRVS